MRIGYDFACLVPGAEHYPSQFIERNGFGTADLDGVVEWCTESNLRKSGQSEKGGSLSSR